VSCALATTITQTQIQTFFAVNPPYSLQVHHLTLAAQQHVQPVVSEARPCSSELAQTHPQRPIVSFAVSVVPARAM